MNRNRTIKCAYCSNSIHRNYATLLPVQEDLRDDWFRALGPIFKAVCSLKTRPQICLSHFEKVENCRRGKSAIPTPLPYRNNNLGEKVKRPKKSAVNKNQRKFSEVKNQRTGANRPIEEELGNESIRHCYNRRPSCKNEESKPGSFLRTSICHICSRPLNPFQSYPIGPWIDLNQEIRIHQMHLLGRINFLGWLSLHKISQ